MPVWLCLTCYGTAHGWANGSPCIHCGSYYVVGTADDYRSDTAADMNEYRLVHLNRRQWRRVQSEAQQFGQSVRTYLAEREDADSIVVRDLGIVGGKLVLCRRSLATSRAPQPVT